MGSRNLHICPKVAKVVGSTVGHRIGYNGVGAFRVQRNILRKIHQSTPLPRPPHAPFLGLYLPPQTWISRLNCIFHIAIASRILSEELATCLNSYIVAKADTLFEGRSNCHSGKYLIFDAKQNVSSPFQSTQPLSLAQIKGFLMLGRMKRCCKFHTLRKLISIILFMLGQYTTSRTFSYRYVIVRLFFDFGS